MSNAKVQDSKKIVLVKSAASLPRDAEWILRCLFENQGDIPGIARPAEPTRDKSGAA
jgi:hypothetical protein